MCPRFDHNKQNKGPAAMFPTSSSELPNQSTPPARHPSVTMKSNAQVICITRIGTSTSKESTGAEKPTLAPEALIPSHSPVLDVDYEGKRKKPKILYLLCQYILHIMLWIHNLYVYIYTHYIIFLSILTALRSFASMDCLLIFWGYIIFVLFYVILGHYLFVRLTGCMVSWEDK